MKAYLGSIATNIVRYGVPKRFKIGDVWYGIFWAKNIRRNGKSGQRIMGMCDTKSKHIFLSMAVPRKMIYTVLLHELLHALSYEKKIRLTERQVMSLGLNLGGLLRFRFTAS